MKKLFYAKQVVDVMFLSDKEEGAAFLKKEAEYFLQEELRNMVPGRLVVKEITLASDVPTSWRSSILWGQNDDELNPIVYLKQVAKENDPEYKDYLRLNQKFDGIEEDDL